MATIFIRCKSMKSIAIVFARDFSLSRALVQLSCRQVKSQNNQLFAQRLHKFVDRSFIKMENKIEYFLCFAMGIVSENHPCSEHELFNFAQEFLGIIGDATAINSR